jgi:hypothetical protein
MLTFGLGVVVNAYNPNYLGGRGRRIMSLRSVWAKFASSYFKNKINTKGLGVLVKW